MKFALLKKVPSVIFPIDRIGNYGVMELYYTLLIVFVVHVENNLRFTFWQSFLSICYSVKILV